MILIVEDDERLTRFLTATFDKMNWRSCVAQNGVDAYRLIRRKGLTCLLLDIRMPMVNGLEVLSIMKRENIAVPTVVMTGADDFDVHTLEAFPNVIGFIGKPFSATDIVEMLLPHMAASLPTAADRLRSCKPSAPAAARPGPPRHIPRTWRK